VKISKKKFLFLICIAYSGIVTFCFGLAGLLGSMGEQPLLIRLGGLFFMVMGLYTVSYLLINIKSFKAKEVKLNG